MVCIYCGGSTHVSNSRPQQRSNAVWRRRTCYKCLASITTLEKPDFATAVIVTTGTHHKPFSRDKLFISIYESCKHRKTAQKDASALTETVLNHLLPQINDAALTRDDIVQETAKVLARFDKAAASYYSAYHASKE